MPKPSTWPRAAAKPKLRPKYSAATGAVTILPWSNYWNAIYPNCWPSSDFPNTSGESCAPPTSSNAASSKCAEEPAPWSASSTCSPWTVSSTPSSRNSTWNGKHAPSALLHKRLDVTILARVWRLALISAAILFLAALEIATIGYFPGLPHETQALTRILWRLAVAIIAAIAWAILAAFAHDLEVGDMGSRLPRQAARQSGVH